MNGERAIGGKRVTVMGLGLHGGGVDTVRFLVAHGAEVLVTDMQSPEALRTSLDRLRDQKSVCFVLGQHRMKDFEEADVVIKSPGIPWDNPYILSAQRNGAVIYTDASLFYELVAQPTIGVTGSKGKTTVAQMIVHILAHAQKNPVAVGISQEPVLGKIAAITRGSIPVCELSSWRLASMARIEKSPHIAVVTNILCDHQNYYGSMDYYERDKFAITQHQSEDDVLIVNGDDERLAQWESAAKTLSVSLRGGQSGADFFVEGDSVYERVDDDTHLLYKLSSLHISGQHNATNALLATAVARQYSVSHGAIAEALASFTGVPHRFEMVAAIDGVRYINDTAATMPDATIASIAACDVPPIVIVGGADKALRFEDFAHVLTQRVKACIFLPGTATQKILAHFSSGDRESVCVVETMREAVDRAHAIARSGDIVLLSPGAASFGLFANEFERGDAFTAAVKKYEE